jgi:DNA repair protein RadC
MHILAYKEQVREKLLTSPSTRDNDNELIAIVLESVEQNIESMSAKDLISSLKSGKYGSFESITRSRRYLQQHNQELRGDLWDRRHKLAKGVAAQLMFNF